MSLEKTIMDQMKTAMKAKDAGALRTLRAIKAELLKEKTKEGATGELTEADEMRILSKMAKQRKDSMETYKEQNRQDLLDIEAEELKIIQQFLPEQMGEEELTAKLQNIIEQNGVQSPSEMGKIMGIAMKELAGKADGKQISAIVKKLLSQ